MYISFTPKSSNSKTGPIPVTTSSRKTCPATCPFIGDGGCYAEAGFYTRLHWDKVTNGERGTDWITFGQTIAALPPGTLWRHNIAGDLPHTGGVIDIDKAHQMAFFASRTQGFTYTHHDMGIRENRDAVAMLNDSPGMTVNLSANNLDHADKLAALDIGPVAVVLPGNQMENTVTPNGRKVVVCPAIKRDDVTCATCKLCARKDRPIIGFPAHGSRSKAAEKVISIDTIGKT